MNETEIVAALATVKSSRDLRKLLPDLKSVDPELLFRTLFPIAARSQGDGPVAFSAVAIYKLNPPCLLTPVEAITQMIELDWDISIEEVPWYLANQFGDERILECAKELLRIHLDENAQVLLKTVIYWVQIKQNEN